LSYLTILLGLFTALPWGTSDYLSRSQSERVGHYNTTKYMHITTFVILVALVPLLSPPLAIGDWPASFLLFAGALNFFAEVFLLPLLEG